MGFYVVETQTNTTGTMLWNFYNEREDAEQKYHQILSYAAKSSIRVHGAMIVEEDMSIVKTEAYRHEPAAEPEEQTEE